MNTKDGILRVVEGGVHSPWIVTLFDMKRLFARSPERVEIFREFYELRAQLKQIGLGEGFQWVSGSFVDQTSNSPRIEVVTFYPRGLGIDLLDLPRGSLSVEMHYLEDLDVLDSVRSVAKWVIAFSMCEGHDQSVRWKGFLSVALDESAERSSPGDPPIEEPFPPKAEPRKKWWHHW